MKQLILYIIFLTITIGPLESIAQNNAQKGYTIENDTVVFTFDSREYTKYTKEYTGQTLDFEEFDIENVVVSGEFNQWSRDHWKMKRVDKFTYQLKKSLSDFTDEFSWEFKFVINNTFWAEPSKQATNISKAVKNGQRLHGIYNLKLYTAYPDELGNASFKLNGHTNAKKVILAGSFNKWDEDLFEMNKTKNGWELTLQMNPDVYQYRFIVDGIWIEDLDNPDKSENEYGEYNSVIDIKAYTTFKLKSHKAAQKVILAGSFNDWDEHELEMRKMDYGWKYVIPLSGGKHHYKFIVDGQWIVDPNNSVKEYDGDGHINSVHMVK